MNPQAGEAVVAQTDEVLAAIQRLRAEAQENGYLVDNEAQTVEEVNDNIVIAPANPGVVYVPTYDSQVVYSTPIAGPPVYHYGYGYDYDYYDDDWDDALVAGGIILGGAVILDEIFDDDDWDGWDGDDDIDWDGGDITIDRGDVDIDIDRDDIDIGDDATGPTDRRRRPRQHRRQRSHPGRPWRSRRHRRARRRSAARRGLAGEPVVDLERGQPRRRAPEDRGAQDQRGRSCDPGNAAAGRLPRVGVRVARPGAVPLDDPVCAGNLATEGEPDPDGPGAEPFERLRAAVALAPFGVQQPWASERGSSRGRPRRRRPERRWPERRWRTEALTSLSSEPDEFRGLRASALRLDSPGNGGILHRK